MNRLATLLTAGRRQPAAVLLVVVGLLVLLWVASRGWTHPLTDSHSSRQAQTALTAALLLRQGPIPLTPFNGLGPPWSLPMEFPVYQLMVAGTAGLSGVELVSAARAVSVLGALVLLPVLWRLLTHAGFGPLARAATLALLAASPLFAHYARAVLIETWALTLAAAWLLAAVEGLSDGPRAARWRLAAVGLGVLAALSKVTTFAVFLVPVAMMVLIHLRRRGWGNWGQWAMIILPGIIAAVWWTRATDAVKAAHPYADFLTSSALHTWNWGTWSQRLDPATWSRWAYHLTLITPGWLLLLIPVGLIWGQRSVRVTAWVAVATVAAGPLAFANLYYVHDYYFMAVAPAVVVALGAGLATLFTRFETRRGAVVGSVVLVLGMLAWQVQAYADGLGRGQVRNRPVPALATLLHDLTGPEDTIVILGREWDPLVTYYADRRLTFVRETHETDEQAWSRSRAALAPLDYTVLVAFDSIAGDGAFLHHRCRELGLLTDPVASTPEADIYVSAPARDRLGPVLARLRQEGRLLAEWPNRMGPGESRLEFITADWRPLGLTEAGLQFPQCEPYPDSVFTRNTPAQIDLDGVTVLHLHPPGGLRFNAVNRDRTVILTYGILPEIWEKERDTDGVRFRAFVSAPGARTRLQWQDWVRPRSDETDRGPLTARFPLPAGHDLELQLDAGPDHNPGYDWSYLASVQVR